MVPTARHIILFVAASFVLMASAWPATAQTTFLFMHSQPGDYIGAGVTRTLTPLDGNFSATRNFDNGVTVRFDGGSNWWYLNFAAPQEALLTPGSYENATRFPIQSPTAPGLDVSGSGRGCNMLTGRFDVFEVVYGSGDTITSFAANFEQHCEGMAPALFGSIRFNAATMAPHSVSVTLQGSGSGTVTSVPAGINCGTDCDEPFTNGTVVALIAGPSAGSSFAGWSGDADCSDGVVSKAMPAACTASFAPCSVSLAPTSSTGVSSGGNGVLSVTASGPTCEWSASSSASWLRIIGATNGTGGGSISYFYEARGTFAQPRVATITVSGQVFTLTQSGIAPVFSVAPTTVDVGPGIGTTVLQVTANTLDAVWTATTSTSWISVPASGGVGAVTVGLSRNASQLPRAGSLTIAGINVAVTQLGNAIPGEPTDLGAAVLHGQARFEWSPPQTGGDATIYQLEAGLSPGAASAVFKTTNGTPAFVLSGVPAGVFYLRVRGGNEYGLGPASEEYKLTVTAAGMNQPGPPRNVVATITSATTSGSRLSMAWDPPAPVGSLDGYVLEVGSATNSSDLVVLPLGLATTFGYDPLPSGYYFVRVRALNGAGAGAPSPEILLTSGGVPSPPGAPRVLTSVVSGATVNLNWLAPQSGGAPLRYRLEVGSSPGLSNLAVVETPIATTAVGFTGVPAGRYYVRIRGVNVQGAGPISNEVRIDVP